MIKKILFISLGLAFVATPLVASAQTASDLQSELATLQQQLSQLAAQLGTVNTNTSTSNTGTNTITTAVTPPDNESNATNTGASQCPALSSELSQVAGQNTDASTGGQVSQLQQFLAVYFNLSPNSIVTGFFGPTTASYVSQFQGENGIPQVGYVGSQTRAAIASVCSASTNPASTTSFSASPSAGQAPFAVSFTASGSGVNASTTIDFGDGSTSTLSTIGNIGIAWGASHTYTSAGTYTARIEIPATSASGITGVEVMASTQVIVAAASQSTIGFSASPSAGPAPLTVSFTYPTSDGGDIIDFGDNSTTTLPTGCSSDGVTTQSCGIVHTYTATSTYTAEIINSSATPVATASVNVTTSGASFAATPTSGLSPLTVTFTTTGGAGDTLNFGDGQTGSFASSCSQTAACTATHTYMQSGTYTATMEDASSDIVGTETINVSANASSIQMTVPGSVQLSSGQTAVESENGGTSPVFTLNTIDTNGSSATDAQITAVTGWSCPSGSASCTAATTANATLTLNAPQVIGGQQFTLTALTPTSATIAVAQSTGLTFSVPGTVSFTAVGQVASDAAAGYDLQLNSVNASTLLAGVTWSTHTPCNTQQPGGDCAITPLSTNSLTLALGTPQTTTGNITLLLSALSGGGATINITGGTVQPDYSVTATPASGASPLSVSLSYSATLQNFVSAYCEEAQGTSQYNVVVDWGDGAGPQNSPSTVCNPHTYNAAGPFTIHVSVYPAGNTTALWTGSTLVTVTPGKLVSCLMLNPTLTFGPGATDATTGGEVTELQQFLAADPAIYPQGLVTGYYGPATTAAVQNYQASQDIVNSGSPSTTGFGFVGPHTLQALVKDCPTFSSQFSATPTSGAAPLMATFSATGTPGTYSIAFGDGSTDSVTVPVVECPTSSCTGQASDSHTYQTAGTYTATLSRLSCNGADPSTCANPTASTLGTATITVGSSNTLTASVAPGTPLSVTFTTTMSPAAGGPTYTVNFGDGQTGQMTINNSSAFVLQHTYAQSGTYTATLLQYPNCGNSTAASCGDPVSIGTVTVTVSAATLGSCTAALPTHDMSLGMSDSDVAGDVTLLQNFLISQGDLPADDNTGFFGNATQAAVEQFQQANNVSPVSGIVGPLTRAAMLALCQGQKPSSSVFSFAASPASGAAPLSTTFTVSNAETLESGLIYVVDFGDGSQAPLSSTAGSATTLTVSHTYAQNGTFVANLLQQRNLCGGILTTSGCVADLQVASTSVTVAAGTPLSVSCSATPSSIAPGGPVTWSATASGGAGGYAYAWSDSAGNTKNTSSTASWSQTYASAASVTGSLTVTDSSGATGKASCGTVTVAPTSQTFSVGTDCNGTFCSADQSTANQLCVTKGFASASSMQSYSMTQSNPNAAGPTGNESWWNGIAWQYWWAGQCNTGGVCTPGNAVSNELSQVTCTGTAPASLVGTANLPAATNLSSSCTGNTAMFSWTPQGTVLEWQLTLSAGAGGAWECQPSSNQLCSTMVYNTLNPTFSTTIPAGIPFTWSVAPEQQSNGATGPSVAGPGVSCDVQSVGEDNSTGGE